MKTKTTTTVLTFNVYADNIELLKSIQGVPAATLAQQAIQFCADNSLRINYRAKAQGARQSLAIRVQSGSPLVEYIFSHLAVARQITHKNNMLGATLNNMLRAAAAHGFFKKFETMEEAA